LPYAQGRWRHDGIKSPSPFGRGWLRSGRVRVIRFMVRQRIADGSFTQRYLSRGYWPSVSVAALSAYSPREISRGLGLQVLGPSARAHEHSTVPLAARRQRWRSESAGADSKALGTAASRLGLHHLHDDANRLSARSQEVWPADRLLLPPRLHVGRS